MHVVENRSTAKFNCAVRPLQPVESVHSANEAYEVTFKALASLDESSIFFSGKSFAVINHFLKI